MGEYERYVARARAQHGDRFDPVALEAAGKFRRYFRGPRIKVRTTYAGGETHERTGIVSVTTGWQPAFLLMHRSSDSGSWDLLGARDEIVAVQMGRTYVPVGREAERCSR